MKNREGDRRGRKTFLLQGFLAVKRPKIGSPRERSTDGEERVGALDGSRGRKRRRTQVEQHWVFALVVFSVSSGEAEQIPSKREGRFGENLRRCRGTGGRGARVT